MADDTWPCDASTGVSRRQGVVSEIRIGVCRKPGKIYKFPGWWSEIATCDEHYPYFEAKYGKPSAEEGQND